MFKTIILTVFLFYIFVFWIGLHFFLLVFPTSKDPAIAIGITVLAGLIVGCTYYLAQLIKKNK